MAKKEKQLISLSDYAKNYNGRTNRRGHKMSESYLYRLIRDHSKGNKAPELWFKYIFKGDKDRIFIEL